MPPYHTQHRWDTLFPHLHGSVVMIIMLHRLHQWLIYITLSIRTIVQITLIGFKGYGSYISVIHTQEKKTSIKGVVFSPCWLGNEARILAVEKVRTMHVKDVVTRIPSYVTGLVIYVAVKTCIFTTLSFCWKIHIAGYVPKPLLCQVGVEDKRTLTHVVQGDSL